MPGLMSRPVKSVAIPTKGTGEAMTIIYERVGIRMVRLTHCLRCNAVLRLQAGQSPRNGLLCAFCKRKDRIASRRR